MKFKSFMEALKGKQHKIDKNKNGKIDAHDFKLLRKEEAEEVSEETILEGAYEKAEENKRSADVAKKQGDMFAHHLHMADHHDNMAEWHSSRGRHGEADKHAEKSEQHHEMAMQHKDKVKKEEVELEESVADSWKKVQSMDKGSVTGGKDAVKKRLAYLQAVHDHHKRFGNDTKKVKKEIESINRSRIAEEVEELEEAKSPQQKADFDRMMAGAMSRAAYNAKWKKPLKSDDKVIYGKNVKEETQLDEAEYQARADYKLDKSGKKYHKQIEFKDGSNDDAKEKYEVREEAEMNEEMTDAQMKKREDYVKGMKKNIDGFKAKYGSRAKEVMYATATKMAMKEETIEEAAGQHKVMVTVSDPNHSAASMRKEKIMKRVIVNAETKDHAVTKAKEFYKKKGYKVHDAEYHSAQPKSTMATEEALSEDQLVEAVKKTLSVGTKVSHAKHGSGKVHMMSMGGGNLVPKDSAIVKFNDGTKKTVKVRDLQKEETELDEEQLDERNKENAMKRKMMDASRGARYKTAGNPVPDREPEHKTAQAHNKAIGRALRNEEAEEIEEQAPVAPVPGDKWKDHAVMVHKDSKQRVVIQRANKKNYPEHEGWKEVSPGHKVKEDVDFDEEGNLMAEKKTYAQFMEQLLEYESKDGRYVHTKGSYGKSYQGDDDEDGPKKKPAEPAVKRGRGRPAGSKSGANQKVTSGKSYGGIAYHSLNLPNTK